MVILTKFGSPAVIDYQNPDIVADMTISDRIHIVEKRKIAENTETKSGRVGQRSPDQRRDAAVDPEPADVRIGKHGLRYFEEIHDRSVFRMPKCNTGVLRKKRRHLYAVQTFEKGKFCGIAS